jgi:transcriptional regulator with XRE-family HTH domain
MKSKVDLYVMNKVRERRTVLKLSQLALANELGMSSGFVGQVESPRYPAKYNVQHLNDLAKILKCSPQDFLPKKAL